MGQQGSRIYDLRRALRENDVTLASVELDGVRLSEKDVRKLSEALRLNWCVGEKGWIYLLQAMQANRRIYLVMFLSFGRQRGGEIEPGWMRTDPYGCAARI